MTMMLVVQSTECTHDVERIRCCDARAPSGTSTAHARLQHSMIDGTLNRCYDSKSSSPSRAACDTRALSFAGKLRMLWNVAFKSQPAGPSAVVSSSSCATDPVSLTSMALYGVLLPFVTPEYSVPLSTHAQAMRFVVHVAAHSPFMFTMIRPPTPPTRSRM